MITLTVADALLSATTIVMLTAAVAVWRTRAFVLRQQRVFDRYRGAMLDDWRYASDKVIRLRKIIHTSRSIAAARDELRMDDQLFPPLQNGIQATRRS